jgi:hypothetical protein
MPRVLLLLFAIAAVVALVSTDTAAPQQPLIPRHLETPSFEGLPPPASAVATVATLTDHIAGEPGRQFGRRWMGPQGLTLVMALAIAMLVTFNVRHPRAPRHLELLLALVPGFLLFDGIRLLYVLDQPAYRTLTDWLFLALFAVSSALAAVAIWRVFRPHQEPLEPNLSTPRLVGLACLLFAANIWLGLTREPDDAGFYTNLGAQRLREHRMFPYGDPLLGGTPGAAYGPVLYVAHLPFQWLLSPGAVNEPSLNPPEIWEGDYYYWLPSAAATQLVTALFHTIGVAALVSASTGMAGARVAWAVAALYCSSPYVMGVGGEQEFIGGMTFISHIAPAALTLLAFAWLAFPIVSGFTLALAVATVFYPAFFIPAWLGFYARRPGAQGRCLLGLALAALLVGGTGPDAFGRRP